VLKFGQICLPNPSEGGAFTFEMENDLGIYKQQKTSIFWIEVFKVPPLRGG